MQLTCRAQATCDFSYNLGLTVLGNSVGCRPGRGGCGSGFNLNGTQLGNFKSEPHFKLLVLALQAESELSVTVTSHGGRAAAN